MSDREKVALVTGASRGIGRYLAGHLVERGYFVVGCSRSPTDGGLEHAEHVLADVGDEGQVVALVEQIQKRHGRLDVVLNNAGIAAMNPALLTPHHSAHAIVQTNFLGTFLVCRESARLMMRRKWGRIVNFTSIAVPLALEGEAIYAAAKSAVETFTRIFAREVAPYGISVNAVGPSPIETDLIRGVPKEKLDALVQRLAIKRLGCFADVANVIDFFLRPESDFITGQTIYLGGAG